MKGLVGQAGFEFYPKSNEKKPEDFKLISDVMIPVNEEGQTGSGDGLEKGGGTCERL